MDFSKISINGETRWNDFFFAQIERKHIFAQIQIVNISQNMKKIRFLALLAALICLFSTIVRANSLELKGETIQSRGPNICVKPKNYNNNQEHEIYLLHLQKNTDNGKTLYHIISITGICMHSVCTKSGDALW